MKKVLIIAHPFPPSGGGGVQRTTKFVKYLPGLDWKPIVLTVKPKYYSVIDETLNKDLSQDLKVIRTKSLFEYDYTNKSTFYIYYRKICTYCLSKIIYPDIKIGWMFFALPVVKKIIKQENIKLVYTTGNPFSTHLIGLYLKKISKNIKWVADFRDLWSVGPLSLGMNPFRRHIERKMEEKVFDRADKIICATQKMQEVYEGLYQNHRDKIVTIKNGYDEDDFKDLTPIQPKKFIITHVGSLGSYRNPHNFFVAYKNFISKNNLSKDSIVLNLVGRISHDIIKDINALNLKDFINIAGYVSHKNGIEILLKSSILLLYDNYYNQSNTTQMGKTFEYLRAHKFILAVIPPGGTRDLVNECQCGICVDPTNIDQIKKTLNNIYKKYLINPILIKVSDNQYKINKYNRKNLTYKLVKIFNNFFV